VSAVEVLVVRGAFGVTPQCGGVPMISIDDAADGSPPGTALEGQVQQGKRFFDEESGLELLCTKAGAGSLTCDSRQMALREPRPLPSSD
jgi:hypothetical protein